MLVISYEGRKRATVNYLKALYFDGPEWTPFVISLMPATWMKYRGALEEIVLAHPRCFPGYEKGSKDFDEINNPLYELGEHVDCWGVVWHNIERGLDSFPVRYPLERWDDFADWTPPDPLTDALWGPRDWDAERRRMAASLDEGGLASGGGLPHGFFYLLLTYLRGFENLMVDFAVDDPHVYQLIKVVEQYNVTVIGKYLEMRTEIVSCGEDLGIQHRLPISPTMWRKFIKPSYEAMFGPCRDLDIPVYLHTDGHILEIIPDLIEVGVRILNPQIRANGLAGLQEVAKGNVCIHLDLDRQLFPFATPSEIEDHVGAMVEGLFLPEGGLMIHAECEPDVSLENIDALCSALETVLDPPLLTDDGQ